MLFKRLTQPDRQQTQFAYRVKYWPYRELTYAQRDVISRQHRRQAMKHEIEVLLNDDLNELTWHGVTYHVVWAYNNQPTEQEWNGKSSSFVLSVEFRHSPAIDCYAVAILSFDLPSERIKPHRNGEFS